jgi:hypothetical protein
MAESTIGDTEMILYYLIPDGPVDGVPQWNVLSGNGTLHADPSHPDWDASLPEGFQMFLVAPTLPNGQAAADTTYEVSADIDMGSGVMPRVETITLHVENRLTTLGLTAKEATPKP